MYNGGENHGSQPWSTFRYPNVNQPADVQNGNLPVLPQVENDATQSESSLPVLPQTISNDGNTLIRSESYLPRMELIVLPDPVYTITPPLVFHTTSTEEDLRGNRNQLQDPSEMRRKLMDRYFEVDMKLSLAPPGSFCPPPPLQSLLMRMPVQPPAVLYNNHRSFFEEIDRTRLLERLSAAAMRTDNDDYTEGTENNSDIKRELICDVLNLPLRP